MKISACPKCGGKDIPQGNLRDGILTGYTVKYVCKDCDYQGIPIIFGSEKEYNIFLKCIKKEEKGEMVL